MFNKAISSIYLAGLLQGLALVAFPAASTTLTSQDGFGFSSTLYGSLFIPQALFAIFCSLKSFRLIETWGIKTLYLRGLVANLLAMGFFSISALFMHERQVATILLMLATSFLGCGFGFTVPVINTQAALFFPNKSAASVLIMNVLLGLGTALAPVLTALFSWLGAWWGLPLSTALALAAIITISWPLAFSKTQSAQSSATVTISNTFWHFALFSLLYGILETLNGNWLMIYMTHELDATTKMASLALTLFWAMVTAGRLFFASIERLFSEQTAYRTLPYLLFIGFSLLWISGSSSFSVVIFSLLGFGCSALLPLTISFGQDQLPSMRLAVASGVIAFYLMGYGVAAFSVGPLMEHFGLNLKTIYGGAAILSLFAAALARKLSPIDKK